MRSSDEPAPIVDDGEADQLKVRKHPDHAFRVMNPMGVEPDSLSPYWDAQQQHPGSGQYAL
jgi:hypothetical protein